MLYSQNKLVFTQLIDEISGSFLNKTITKYGGDYRMQYFDTKSHLYVVLYSNFRTCKSLRELQIKISSSKKLKYLMNALSILTSSIL